MAKMEDSGWMRAAVLGANDGIVSTGSLIVGVAASNSDHHALIVAGVAGVVAGAMSMATGEYVSVHTQSDLEKAALDREKRELKKDAKGELEELTGIYMKRGLDRKLASQVARKLTQHDALAAHARDELGMSKASKARPLQAAMASAASFGSGGAFPLLIATFMPDGHAVLVISAAALVALAILGAVSAHLSGAPVARAVARVTFWSALALGITATVGKLFGATG